VLVHLLRIQGRRVEAITTNLLLGDGEMCARSGSSWVGAILRLIMELTTQEFFIELELGLNCLGGLGQTCAKLVILGSEPKLELRSA